MTQSIEQHPVCKLCDSAQNLEQQTTLAEREVENGARRAQKAVNDLANLDMENIFSQLHQMVALVTNKPAQESKAVYETAQAAE